MSSVNYSLNHKGVRLIDAQKAWVKTKTRPNKWDIARINTSNRSKNKRASFLLSIVSGIYIYPVGNTRRSHYYYNPKITKNQLFG